MIIRSRKFKLDKPITLDGEFEITTMTGMSGLIISTGPDTKVTARPIEDHPTTHVAPDIEDIQVPDSVGGD